MSVGQSRPATATGNTRVIRGILLVCRAAVIGLLNLLGIFFFGAAMTSLELPGAYNKDLLQDYLMARAIVHGTNPYLPMETLARLFLNVVPVVPRPTPTPHPPSVGVLFLPFSFLDYQVAATIWMAIEVACLVAAVHAILCRSSLTCSRMLALLIAIPLLAWYPVFSDLANGQLMTVLLLDLTCAWVAIRTGRSLTAGALIGLGISIKPLVAPVALVFVLHRRWAPLASCVGITLLGYTVATAVIGIGSVVRYFTEVLPVVSRLYGPTSLNLSLWNLGPRVFGETSLLSYGQTGQLIVHTAPLLKSSIGTQLTSVVIPVVAMVIAVVQAYRHLDIEWSMGLFTVVSVLVSPIAWAHYLVLLLIPTALVARALMTGEHPLRWATATALVAILLLIPDIALANVAFSYTVSRSNFGQAEPLPFIRALPMMEPTLATVALAILIGCLGSRQPQCTRGNSPLANEPTSTPTSGSLGCARATRAQIHPSSLPTSECSDLGTPRLLSFAARPVPPDWLG